VGINIPIKSTASSLLAKVNNCLTEQDINSYVVGGFVRDALLERDTADIDIAIASDALEIAPRVATALGGKYVLLDRVNRIGRVILISKEASSREGQWELDFSTFEGTIEQDLARRDFTIDAMAVNLGHFGNRPADVQLIDPFDGLNDLRQGIVRAVTKTTFESDAARLLRAVRLAAELGFSIDKETEGLIRLHSHLITSVAGERVREELLRLLAISASQRLLTYLDELGLLTALIPELSPMKGVAQPREHFWDVFNHSLNVVSAVDYLLRQGTWEYASEEVLAIAPWSAQLAQHFNMEVSHGSTGRLLLKLAALLHDIAKPQTKAIDTSRRTRFLGHAREGADVVVNILGRLRFSTKEIKLIETMVRHHLRPTQMSDNELPTHRAIYRYFRDTGEAGIDTLFLSLADHLATRGPHLDMNNWRKHANMVEYVLTQHSREASLTAPPKLVDGHDLVRIFGISPGPEIGELLEVVREAQASGEVATRDEALAYLREHQLSKAV